MLTWKESANGPINGKCNLTLIALNKQIKLFSPENLIQQMFFIHLLSLIIITLLNVLAKSTCARGIALDSKLNFNSHAD